ncbi:uncharacterized protein LOC126841234 [Adelges cooleyi]|uniref:uncharacterized protein LOC126841234 n=1 Tax=Adelges cooleyi TaxID=133065 RepID=UPI002180117A|nr:uncharacterized protein LOC126841234 [Adelges cooleyi]
MDNVFKTTKSLRAAFFKKGFADKSGTTIPGGNSGANSLELVIAEMASDITAGSPYYDFCKMNFLIAVQDQLEIVSEIEELPNDEPYEKANKFFRAFEQYIEGLLGFTYADTYNESHGTATTLANKGRAYVSTALNRLTQLRVLGFKQRENDYPTLAVKCRIMGLYLSSQSPELYIKKVDINPADSSCTYTNKNNDRKKYSYFNGIWSEISFDDPPRSLQSLEDLLKLVHPPNPPTS